MIESAATYTQSIYKCKGCPPQNQSTVLQFFIRGQPVWGILPSAAFASDFDLRKTSRPCWFGTRVQRQCCLQPASIQDSFLPASRGTARSSNAENNVKSGRPECHPEHDYPFTLTREKDRIARPVVGLPMESAGRKVVKVVKISMFFFNWGSNGSSSLESERMR